MEKLKLIKKRMDKCKVLSNKIHKLKGKDEISTSLSGEYQEHIMKENSNLKEENKSLKKRVEIWSYTMPDLNTKVKDLEDEKQSLITAMKILQYEY